MCLAGLLRLGLVRTGSASGGVAGSRATTSQLGPLFVPQYKQQRRPRATWREKSALGRERDWPSRTSYKSGGHILYYRCSLCSARLPPGPARGAPHLPGPARVGGRVCLIAVLRVHKYNCRVSNCNSTPICCQTLSFYPFSRVH